MTEHHDSERAQDAHAQVPSDRPSSRWTFFAPLIALLAGLVIGGLVVGLIDDDGGVSAGSQPTTSPTDTGEPQPTGDGGTTVVVPDACLDAVDTVEEATRLTQEGAGAIRDFRTAELRSLLRELEELDQQAREQAQACREAQADQSPAPE